MAEGMRVYVALSIVLTVVAAQAPGAVVISTHVGSCIQEFIRPTCPTDPSNKGVTKIRITAVHVSYKAPTSDSERCGGPEVDSCRHFLLFNNPFYLDVLKECQSKPSCLLLTPTNLSTPCPDAVNIRNYVEILYDCLSTAPIHPSYPTTSEATNTSIDVNSTNTDRVEAPLTDDQYLLTDVNIPALIICLAALLLITTLLILAVICYRRKKLPKSVQSGVRRMMSVISKKFLTNLTARRTNQLQGRPEVKLEIENAAYVEDAIYSDIDNLDTSDKDSSYQGWSGSQIPVAGQLPKILAVPNQEKPILTHALSQVDDDDDGNWEDSEFDDVSDDEEGVPAQLPYAGVTGVPRSYHVLEGDNSNSCSCEKTIIKGEGNEVYAYCKPTGIHTHTDTETLYDTVAGLKEGHNQHYDVVTKTDDSDYYSTAAPYMEDSTA